ncbi:cytochrome P450 [Gloeophyllum trabeum ATCC 11539]|uniref:Cytochrome P450 n=1 Tax=Gloeophyllum trabeum (strain ATCC 11539 / FP-39264 / Madison 617) TaxID=670483 RepID=S7RYW3_GLOTA|nr:cytochrome P450 [Gloeophyllum trabeum ATCC 11539]EPQ58609.1 cytochrome P450 [Gloeophyllum trabeum ATCC 11539]
MEIDATYFAVPFSGLVVAVAFLYWLRCQRHTTAAPLPPGPKAFPLIGNVLDIPRSKPWNTFTKWGRRYGPIVHVSAFGKSFIILNDSQTAIEMLDKKNRIYNGRPNFVMAGELVGWGEAHPLSQPTQTWSEYRRMTLQFIGTKAKLEAFTELLEQETLVYVQRIQVNPTAWKGHIRRLAGSIVLRMTYGYKAAEEDDAMVHLVDTAMDTFSETTAANVFLVDTFPFLRYLPEWFPGASFKSKARRYNAIAQKMVQRPFEWAKQRYEKGVGEPCFVSDCLSKEELTPDKEQVLKWAAAGICGGGADTTVAGIEAFFFAMASQKDAQERAQAEVDAVVGANRLPTLADRARLPYFEALYLEVIRMYVFIPMGLPHASLEDDIHEGYFIPKGSIMIPNMREIYRDPKTYTNPERFDPQRFLPTSDHEMAKDPRDYLFGFGRRRCPGIYLADASMWLACVAVLAAFDIRPPMEDGKLGVPQDNFTTETISHPEDFEPIIKARGTANGIAIVE